MLKAMDVLGILCCVAWAAATPILTLREFPESSFLENMPGLVGFPLLFLVVAREFLYLYLN